MPAPASAARLLACSHARTLARSPEPDRGRRSPDHPGPGGIGRQTTKIGRRSAGAGRQDGTSTDGWRRNDAIRRLVPGVRVAPSSFGAIGRRKASGAPEAPDPRRSGPHRKASAPAAGAAAPIPRSIASTRNGSLGDSPPKPSEPSDGPPGRAHERAASDDPGPGLTLRTGRRQAAGSRRGPPSRRATRTPPTRR